MMHQFYDVTSQPVILMDSLEIRPVVGWMQQIKGAITNHHQFSILATLTQMKRINIKYSGELKMHTQPTR